MVGILQPLGRNFAIVNEDGTPTEYFVRWAQERQIDISEGVSPAQVTELINDWSSKRRVNAGEGLAGGGPLSSDVTLRLDAGIGDLTDVDLTGIANGDTLVWDESKQLFVPGAGGGGGGGGTKVMYSYLYRDTSFTPSSASTSIPIPFTDKGPVYDKEVLDPLDNTKIVIPPGVVRVRFTVLIRKDGTNFTNNQFVIYKNGTSVGRPSSLHSFEMASGGYNNSGRSWITAVMDTVPGDIFTINVYAAVRNPFFPAVLVEMYSPPDGGGSTLYAFVTGAGTTSSSSYATKGRTIAPLVDMKLSKVFMRFNAVSGGDYIVSITSLSGDVVTQVLSVSDPFTAPSSGLNMIPFDVDALLPAGGTYGITLTRTDLSSTYALPIDQATAGTFFWSGAPTNGQVNNITFAKNTAPLVGDTFITSNAAFSGDLLYTIPS